MKFGWKNDVMEKKPIPSAHYILFFDVLEVDLIFLLATRAHGGWTLKSVKMARSKVGAAIHSRGVRRVWGQSSERSSSTPTLSSRSWTSCTGAFVTLERVWVPQFQWKEILMPQHTKTFTQLCVSKNIKIFLFLFLFFLSCGITVGFDL